MSKFFELPGSHKPPNAEDVQQKPLAGQRRESLTYFDYGATQGTPKVSSRLDPENPNKNKLGTFEGVFVPTTLNVLSILMFSRFGFIIGQMGVLGTIFLLVLSYGINLLTTLSISAIPTNGTVRGGGAYYMISRSLGPEFGGSIGLIFFLGQMLNSGMNVVGIIEPIMYNFGSKIDQETPVLYPLLKRGYWYEFSYASLILLLCLGVALVGSATVSRAGKILFWLLLFSTLSIPISAIFVSPFNDGEITYTGPSLQTLKDNLYPHFTRHTAGSLLKGKETFNDLFGIFFPATAGIFAGAGMSSELRKPSRSIPKGTLWGLGLTFTCYLVVILTIGLCIPRQSLHRDVQIIQTVSASQIVILIGELSTSIFSIIVGIVGAAFVLEAIAKDSIFPGISIFAKKPLCSVLFSWALTQLCLFSDVNQIATFITMTFLMTFVVMNLACFLLEISSAPNFRPSFKYFDWYTACLGGALSIIAMLIVDPIAASMVILTISVIFVVIHLFSAPKPWGDVSQNIIYHQVRKYLLRLRQDNVKYWRPQILLLVDNPRTSWNLIKFCNNLKKGGLYVLGHVTVGESFQREYEEMRKQTKAWVKIRDMANIKAFVQVGTGPTLPWGVRNVFLGSGLGGMKPNITVIGFFDLANYYNTRNKVKDPASKKTSTKLFTGLPASKQNGSVAVDIPDDLGLLPTDVCKNEQKIKVQQWLQIIEDLSLMHSNIAVARRFQDLSLPNKHDKVKKKRYIDLYPIQMSAKVTVTDDSSEGIMATNFDTYTLILQLGAILVTVPSWKKTHCLRVVVFIENESEKHDENKRISNLLGILRIEAEVVVLSLDQFRVYNTIIKGDPIKMDEVSRVLQNDPWWTELKEARSTHKTRRRFTMSATPNATLARNVSRSAPKYNVSQLQRLGVSMSMTSSVLRNNFEIPDISDDDDLDQDPFSDIIEDAKDYRGSEMNNANRERSMASLKAGQKHNPHPKTAKVSDERSVRSLMPVFSSDALPKTKVIEDASGDKPSLIPVVESDNANLQTSSQDAGRNRPLPTLSPCQSSESLLADLRGLSFNDVPSKGQHLILNDVMMQVSRKSDLVFSTLPLPPLNTHKSEQESLEYIENLNVWLDGLPPTMLINSKSTTVTTAL
ncbi:LANO_0F01926g1_1 [Lachancea nothofagi CBS 11611]|uniref:LANO_0F01926g1_1 n=1 Tax=Lachancea nothofagi CBS 11611 TaxID=1266666 RepID=A0A1G4K6H8_9SACH|nr:LANO_0F01926g1_1 [Lachancea nothofagi CBS 11611]